MFTVVHSWSFRLPSEEVVALKERSLRSDGSDSWYDPLIFIIALRMLLNCLCWQSINPR
jgi:hypothetical protein